VHYWFENKIVFGIKAFVLFLLFLFVGHGFAPSPGAVVCFERVLTVAAVLLYHGLLPAGKMKISPAAVPRSISETSHIQIF
jgi:hypothetical protein